MRVYSEEMNVEGNFVYGMISNTDSVGGIKNLTGNDVNLQDGLFEVTLIRELNNPIAVQSLINAFITAAFVIFLGIPRLAAKSFVVPLGIYPIGGFSPLYLRTAATVS